MPRFHYKAVTPGGNLEEGEMDGADEAVVIRSLQAAGYLPIRAARADHRLRLRLRLPARRAWRIAPRQLAAFTHELAALLRAGLTLDHALSLMAGLYDDAGMRRLVVELEAALRNGSSLSAALQQYPVVFPSYYVALVRAGEAGGTLEPTLARLHEHLDQSQALCQDVRAAFTYPALLLAVSLASVAVLLVFVVPQFARLITDSGQSAPPAMQALLTVSALLGDWGWTLPLAAAAAASAVRRRVKTPAGRTAADRMLLRLPLIGDLVRRLEVARFARTLGTLLQNGVPLLAGVNSAADVFVNRALAAAVPGLAESLRQGRGLAAPMLACGEFPSLAVQLIGIGEESGQLDTMLLRVADMLDDEIRRRIRQLLTLLEPALIVVLGMVIAGILYAILSAILGMNDIAL